MFKQPKNELKEEDVKEMVTVVGHSVQVEGNFVSQGDIIIDGDVLGSIKTDRNLKVGEAASVSANVQAANALIAGEVKGNIKIKEHLQLTSTARISGDIRAKVLTIAAGAIFNGKCSMGNTDKIEQKDKVITKEKIERGSEENK